MKGPSYTIYFEPDNLAGALACMDEHGYCVIRGIIDQELVRVLKASIDEVLDPERDLPPASNRFHVTFAEYSEPIWRLAEIPAYMNYVEARTGTDELSWHRSAAILRTPGDAMGGWHTDYYPTMPVPSTADEVLNRGQAVGGGLFYLNGSHPDRSGLAVIEGSHSPDWPGPDGFEMTADRKSFHPEGDDPASWYGKMDVPGCVPLVADPGDLICFMPYTYHTNMATHERRYTCGLGFRAKSFNIDAPWPLPQSAKDRIAALPGQLQRYAEGYTSIDESWSPGN